MSDKEFIFKIAGLRLRVVVPESARVTCSACDGRGYTEATSWLGRYVATFDRVPYQRVPCQWCKGSGVVYEATLNLTNAGEQA